MVAKHSDSIQKSIDAFIAKMKDWGQYYSDLAGAVDLELSSDDEIEDESMIIEGGDWAVFDYRLCSGAYGVSHEDSSISPVKLTNPDKYNLPSSALIKESPVDTVTLMDRYKWFHALFMDWTHVLTPDPLATEDWNTVEDINADYEKEKSSLAGDPYLALYWLMHFGFTLDARYAEVKSLIEQYQLAERLDFISHAIVFFDYQAPDEDIPITNFHEDDKSKLEDLFLKRRSYLLFAAHSYSYAAGAEGLEQWWRSVNFYPKAECYMIQRIRWLGNNLKKYEQWQAFIDLLAGEKNAEPVSLLSYVQAINPLVEAQEQQQYAEQFLQELITDEQLWKGPTERRFGRIMIWELRESIKNKSLLEQACELYYRDDTLSEQFQDINKLLHGENANAIITPVNDALSQLNEACNDFDQYNMSEEQKADLYRSIAEIFDQAREQSTEVLFLLVANLELEILQQRALHYLYTHDIPSKDKTFIDLFIRLEPSDYEIPKIFADDFSTMIKDPSDPNLALMKKVLLIPEEHYRNDYMAEKGQESACMFLLGAAHWPETFAFLMDVIKEEKYNDLANLKSAIFTQLLSREYRSGINPTNAMTQEQLETMLEVINDILHKPEWLEYQYIQDAIRTIYYLENPEAKSWMQSRYNDRTWLDAFPVFSMSYGPLYSEVNEAVGASLKYIEKREALLASRK